MIGVIGDVHGCYATLSELTDSIRREYPDLPLYCVGDLVDRGKFSKEVVEFIRTHDIRTVLGNHDCMFYYTVCYPDHPYKTVWNMNGNGKTLLSYLEHPDIFYEHALYLSRLPLFRVVEGCFISHAGVAEIYRDDLSGSEGWDTETWNKILNNYMHEETGVLWNRETLIKMALTQVVGHTRQQNVYYHTKSNSLYIDTSVYNPGKLSCVIMEEGKLVDTISHYTVQSDIF